MPSAGFSSATTPPSPRTAARDGSTRHLLIAIGIAAALIVARTAVYVIYEQSFFDSDQAIIGLMAKHLIEGRAFPLFYYGLTYMTGVDAWVTAPVFLVAGPTVAALHAALVLMNIAVATLLIVTLYRSMALAPWAALAASIFFTGAPPFTSARLIEAGGNIGPFLYVVLLWIVRRRPLWFGAILAFGFQNREFTIYAVPALLVVQAAEGTLFRASTIRAWALAAVAFCAVWQGINALKPFADLTGPGTRGGLVRGITGSEVDTIGERVAFVPREIPERARAMLADHIPRLIGATSVESATADQGRNWMWWPLGGALIFAVIRSLFVIAQRRRTTAPLTRSSSTEHTSAFGWYLMLVGVCAAAGYTATRPAADVVDRYLLLTLFIPVGTFAVFLATEPRAWLRAALVGLLIVWAGFSASDHLRLAARYRSGTEPNTLRTLADELMARHITVAEANYWRAYKLSFLTEERVKVASTDVVRIDEYQNLAAAEGDRLVLIQETPCAGGEKIEEWYLCGQGQ